MGDRYNHRNRRKHSLKAYIAMETDKDHIRFLISYDTTDRVCDIVKLIKQQTTYHLWQKYPVFCLSVIGNIRYYGLMGTLFVASVNYYQLLYKSTSRAKVDGYKFTRLLPPFKSSWFLPTTTERILIMKYIFY